MNDGNAVVLGAIVGALAAILGSFLTGLVQVYLAGRNAEAAEKAAARQRAAARATENAARKADLYLRWLKWQSNIPAQLVETAISGETISQQLSGEMADFRAELLLYGSPDVLGQAEGMLDVWVDYQDRYKELVEEEAAKPREQQADVAGLAALAASETIYPYMGDQAALMRAELEVLAKA